MGFSGQEIGLSDFGMCPNSNIQQEHNQTTCGILTVQPL